MFKIRKEMPEDYDRVFDIVKYAFQEAKHTNHDEHNLVSRLRKSESFIPNLSLVAELDGEVVGHIMFTKIKINGSTQLILAPIAINPAYQRKGIGGKLILKGHSIAKELGYEYSVLIGHAEYYPRFGYVPASNFGIKVPFDVPDENFMAINLSGKDSMTNGIVEFAKEFFLEVQ